MEIPFFGHKVQEVSPPVAASTAVMEHTPADDEAQKASEEAFKALEPRSEVESPVVIKAPLATPESIEQVATTEPAAPVTELPAVQPVAEETSQSDTNQQISV